MDITQNNKLWGRPSQLEGPSSSGRRMESSLVTEPSGTSKFEGPVILRDVFWLVALAVGPVNFH